MCTLFLAVRPVPGIALAASGNRNEFLERPASPPRVTPGSPGAPSFWAPRDDRAGGTWLGVNDRGLFVTLTNRRHATREAARLSRGALVLEALSAPSAEALQARMETSAGERFNGFHLVFADRAAAFVSIGDGARVETRPLAPGLHVITERSFDGGEGLREDVLRKAFEAVFARGAPTVEQLREPLQAHGPPDEPLESACVHAETFGYGTRSSFQLLVPDPGEVRALWSDGQPCRTAPRDVSGELRALFASAR